MDFRDIAFDVHDDATQELLGKLFSAMKADIFQQLDDLGPSLKKIIQGNHRISSQELEGINNRVGCIIFIFNTLVETARLCMDLDEDKLNDLIEMRDNLQKQSGKLNLAVLVRKSHDRE